MSSAAISVSSAELSVLMSTLPADPAPFIQDSDLVGLDRLGLYARLLAARQNLVSRRLVTVRTDDSLEVSPVVRGMLTSALQPRVGFQLLHTRAGWPPRRVYFSLRDDTIVVHRIDGGQEHTFVVSMDLQVVARTVAATSPMPLTAPGARAGQTFSIPAEVFSTLAQMPVPEAGGAAGDLTPKLVSAGMSAPEAAALQAAGARPLQQTVLTALSLRGQQIGTGSLLWFADNASAWLLSNFAASSPVTVQPATRENIAQAVQTLIRQATSL
jgi:hypothetical protein